MILIILTIWYRFLVDSSPSRGTGVTVDHEHRPHLFYYSADKLIHSYWTENGWQREKVCSSASYNNGGPAAEIDRWSRIHVAFFDSAENLSYGVWENGIWLIETVDTIKPSGDYCDLAIDQNQIPHIVYHRGSYLAYAVKTQSGWRIKTFISEVGGYSPSIEIDDQNHPHITDCTLWGDLRYLHFDGTNWRIEKPVIGNAGAHNSLVLDNFNLPKISVYWTGSGRYDLRFVQKESNSWQIYVVDSGGQFSKKGWSNKIVKDNRGLLHIAYHCHNECLLKHAEGYDSTWVTEVIDTIGGWNASISIAIDDALYIGYCDENNWVWLAVTKNLPSVAEKKDNLIGNEATLINGKILASGRVRIFDSMGREVVDGNFPIPRWITISSSGIFFIVAKGKVKKILVIKEGP
ncbi:hypothetical protein DRP53_07620 [candidate division WOR-3 bacterium]|uniref:Uncharacterized protein n=1 Tax=candidate division WOR-3 bacterium TaxID=2052148 RepID=A0A660SHY3_UNCW3|nr:MAG: hypothetical protein DRP53_07620 [candidate division WOR-3 bacterium]